MKEEFIFLTKGFTKARIIGKFWGMTKDNSFQEVSTGNSLPQDESS